MGQESPGVTLVECWTDGSCANVKGVPQPTGYGIVFRLHDFLLRVAVKGRKGTNQTAELSAIRFALHLVDLENAAVSLRLHSDSQWALRCINGEYKPSMYLDMFQGIWERVEKAKNKIEFVHIRGHVGIYENEMADQLAGWARMLDLTEPSIALVELHKVSGGELACLLTSQEPTKEWLPEGSPFRIRLAASLLSSVAGPMKTDSG